MKYDYKDIMDFFDNEMDKTKYSEFFQNLGSDEELLYDFITHLRFKNAVAEQPQVYENTDELNKKILKALGMSDDPWKKKTFFLVDWYKNKFLQGLVIGVLGLILLYWGFNSFFSKENIPINPNTVSKFNNDSNVITNKFFANNKTIDEKIPNRIQSNSNLRIIHDTIFIEKTIEINKHNSPFSNNKNEIIKDIDSTKFTYQDNSNVYIDKSVQNYNFNEKSQETTNSDEIDESKIKNQLIENENSDIDKTNNLNESNKKPNGFTSLFNWLQNYQFEFKNYQDFYSSPTRSEPSYYNKFNKLGLTIHYVITKSFSAGLDLRQETFNVKYRNEAEKVTVYQQPNLTTLSAEFRYNYFLIDNYLSLNGSLALGANIIGYNFRPNLGFNMYLSNDIYFLLNGNYNFLYFKQYNQFHPADKFSINYGIGVKF